MWETIVANVIGLAFVVLSVWTVAEIIRWQARRAFRSPIMLAVRAHFGGPLSDVAVTNRSFPGHIRVDVQRTVEDYMSEVQPSYFTGMQGGNYGTSHSFAAILDESFGPTNSVSPAPPTYEEVDVGEDRPQRLLSNGLWLATHHGVKLGVIYSFDPDRSGSATVQFAALKGEAGERAADAFFQRIEAAVRAAKTYRGKVLSLEGQRTYTGQTSGVKVHRLSKLTREQVILPRTTLDLLERNVAAFVKSRASLSRFGMATKKGLLFYGPPGVGKTHTIRYLAGTLPDHTTLLVSAAEVCYLSSYISLARLLQPSILVIEDVDLIARDRETMHDAASESLLNNLLNEMDGLKEDSELLFILTTNRPEQLEAALASRPGRIDQAIEFPLPDAEGREKLVRLYAHGMTLSGEVVQDAVARTHKVSASFIKELMRRAAQFHLEHDDSPTLTIDDVKNALDEMVFHGGSLNLKLLGAEGWKETESA